MKLLLFTVGLAISAIPVYYFFVSIQGPAPGTSPTIKARIGLLSEEPNATEWNNYGWEFVPRCTASHIFRPYVAAGTLFALAGFEIAGSFAVDYAGSHPGGFISAAAYVRMVQVAQSGCVLGYVAYVLHTLSDAYQSPAMQLTPTFYKALNESFLECGKGGTYTMMNRLGVWEFVTFICGFFFSMITFVVAQ